MKRNAETGLFTTPSTLNVLRPIGCTAEGLTEKKERWTSNIMGTPSCTRHLCRVQPGAPGNPQARKVFTISPSSKQLPQAIPHLPCPALRIAPLDVERWKLSVGRSPLTLHRHKSRKPTPTFPVRPPHRPHSMFDVDGVVKSPISALRFIPRHCGVP